jgi:hypothetical protein
MTMMRGLFSRRRVSKRRSFGTDNLIRLDIKVDTIWVLCCPAFTATTHPRRSIRHFSPIVKSKAEHQEIRRKKMQQNLLLSLLALVFAAVAIPVESARLVFDGVQHQNESLVVDDALQKRDGCHGANSQLIQKSDVVALANDLQNTGNPWELTFLPSRSSATWSLGTARVCVYNKYIINDPSTNTHVSRWEAGWAVGYINGQCCTAANNPLW